jgi:hypothetical protein
MQDLDKLDDAAARAAAYARAVERDGEDAGAAWSAAHRSRQRADDAAHLAEKITAGRKRLRAAFADLRKAGYLARQNYLCCYGCAGYALTGRAAELVAAGKAVRGAVFYHRQDADDLAKLGRCYLGFGPLHHSPGAGKPEQTIGIHPEEVGYELMAVLHRHNIAAAWDGNPDTRILIDLTREAPAC